MKEPKPPSTEEAIRLRLLRCLDSSVGNHSAFELLEIIASRYSLGPHYELFGRTHGAQDLQVEDLDGRLMATWPGEWPGRMFVDLDNVGDPGAWLRDVFGEPVSTVLFGDAWDDAANAAAMADDYIHTIVAMGYPLPSDFSEDDCPDSDEDLLIADFVSFLRHWRERVVQAIECQAERGRVG